MSAAPSYTADPTLLPAVLALLGQVFPGFTEQERAARRWGLRWEDVSTPFVVRADASGVVVAHVGLLEVPLVLAGQEIVVGGIHAVATHPKHRGRGLYRRAMEATLAYADPRYETLMLSTDAPDIYERFGFRVVSESRFVGPASQVLPAPAARPLELDQEADLAVLHRLLRTRAPLSDRMAVVRDLAVFLFNEARRPLRYAEDLDAVVSLEVADGTLRLYDVVARERPTLAEILARVPEPVERIEAYFAAESLAGDLEPEAHRLDGDDTLMVRGPLAPEGQAIMLPRTSRW